MMNEQYSEEEEVFYAMAPEPGLCLAGDIMINFRNISMIRKLDGRTLVYLRTGGEPMVLPEATFDLIREAAFAMDDMDDDELDDEDEE